MAPQGQSLENTLQNFVYPGKEIYKVAPRLKLLQRNSHALWIIIQCQVQKGYEKKIWRGGRIPYCTHSQKEGTSTSQEGRPWENIFTLNRVGACVTYPKGLRHGRKMSRACQPLLQSLLSEQPVFRIMRYMAVPVGKLFLGFKQDSLVGKC